jgi:hypothetical protein
MDNKQNAIKWFKLCKALQETATAAMIHANGKKRLGKKYLKEMKDRLTYYDMAISAIEDITVEGEQRE